MHACRVMPLLVVKNTMTLGEAANQIFLTVVSIEHFSRSRRLR
jgi:hypothetical protein